MQYCVLFICYKSFATHCKVAVYYSTKNIPIYNGNQPSKQTIYSFSRLVYSLARSLSGWNSGVHVCAKRGHAAAAAHICDVIIKRGTVLE